MKKVNLVVTAVTMLLCAIAVMQSDGRPSSSLVLWAVSLSKCPFVVEPCAWDLLVRQHTRGTCNHLFGGTCIDGTSMISLSIAILSTTFPNSCCLLARAKVPAAIVLCWHETKSNDWRLHNEKYRIKYLQHGRIIRFKYIDQSEGYKFC